MQYEKNPALEGYEDSALIHELIARGKIREANANKVYPLGYKHLEAAKMGIRDEVARTIGLFLADSGAIKFDERDVDASKTTCAHCVIDGSVFVVTATETKEEGEEA